MKSPKKSAPESFCELVESERAAQGLYKREDFCKAARISIATVELIVHKKLPHFKDVSSRRTRCWVRTITRICDVLQLDLDPCLEACGLPLDTKVIQEARKVAQLTSRRYLTEKDLNALLKLARELRKPLPLSFALDYLSLLQEDAKH